MRNQKFVASKTPAAKPLCTLWHAMARYGTLSHAFARKNFLEFFDRTAVFDPAASDFNENTPLGLWPAGYVVGVSEVLASRFPIRLFAL
ncbi:hypothetical protein NG895_12290 [Aeoliella sp. ICT_H6.2]|uniref:Uncharacterized protein n=1 Tax=Aeoliella straminimaris TaxID=2954799 RepID=A0A9X2FAL0_9BACT|nr:hypothetical protein [Aeoliella straminimaris]MCO6044688.1 hypothetical protein [Aeoliella straminimaris]